MIFEMEKGAIKIKQNNVEPKEKCQINMIFKDAALVSGDEIILFVNGEAVNKTGKIFEFNNKHLLNEKESIVEVLITNHKTKFVKYQTSAIIKKYISFGETENSKRSHFCLEQNRRIEELEEKIKQLENKMTII